MALGGGDSGGAGAIRAGLAFVELTANDSQLLAALDRSKAKFQAFAASIGKAGLATAGVGAGILAPIVGAFTGAVERAHDLSLLAEQTGATAEAVSRLSYAFSTVGLEEEDFAKMVKSLQKHLSEAADGADKTFERLGLDARELIRLPLEQQFQKIGDAIGGVALASDKSALAQEFFGKSGARALRLFSDGGALLKARMEEAGGVGAVVTQEMAQQAHQIERSWAQAWASLKYTFLSIGNALLPEADAVKELASQFVQGAAQVREFITEHRGLVLAVAGVGAGLVAAGAALTAFGVTAAAVGAGVSAAFTLVGLAVAAVKAAVLALGGIATVAVSPPFLAMAGLGYLLYQHTEQGKAAFTDLASTASTAWGRLAEEGAATWGTIRETALDAWAGISTALKRGDLRSAGEIAWAGVMVAFRQGVLSFKSLWADVADYFGEIWDKASLNFSRNWAAVVANVKGFFVDLAVSVLGKIADVADFFKQGELAARIRELADVAGAGVAEARDKADTEAIERAEKAAEARKKAREEALAGAKDALALAKDEFARLLGAEAGRAIEGDALRGAAAVAAALNVSKAMDELPERLGQASRGVFTSQDYTSVFGASTSLGQRQLKASEETRDAVKDVENAINKKPPGAFT